MLAKEKIDCSKFRKSDIVEWLYSLGFKPVRINNKEAWYISFFRKGEKNASLRVNRQLQLFIDYGDKKYSGDIIKLGCLLFNTDVSGLLKHLNSESFSFRQQEISTITKTQEPGIIINLVDELVKQEILSYIKSRFISIEIVKKYCKQVTYTSGGRQYNAIGLQNMLNEWELRMPFSDIKLCTKKAITLITNNSETVCLFEGMFDMFSFMQMTPNYVEYDIICLNSVELLQQAMPLLIKYKTVKCYLDNDPKGTEATGAILGMGLALCINMSKEFKEKDLNAHWVAKNQNNKQKEIKKNEERNRRPLSMGF